MTLYPSNGQIFYENRRIKDEIFRERLSQCHDMAQSGEDKFDVINKIIGMAENNMV